MGQTAGFRRLNAVVSACHFVSFRWRSAWFVPAGKLQAPLMSLTPPIFTNSSSRCWSIRRVVSSAVVGRKRTTATAITARPRHVHVTVAQTTQVFRSEDILAGANSLNRTSSSSRKAKSCWGQFVAGLGERQLIPDSSKLRRESK
jgi:hypothetical protein